MAVQGTRWWKPVVDFAVHGLVGTLIFIVIFAPAVVLNWGLHVVAERHNLSHWLVNAATAGEVFLVAADLGLYGWFLFCEAVKAGREMHQEAREGDVTGC